MKSIIYFLAFLPLLSWSQGVLRHPPVERGSQQTLDLLLGYNGFANSFAELGLSWRKESFGYHHPGPTLVAFASSEVRLSQNMVLGPKVGVWAGGGVAGMAMGLNLIAYTDFNEWAVRFRPEIGMGFSQFKLAYGYNVPVTNREFDRIHRHNFSFTFLLPLLSADKKHAESRD